MKPFELLAHDPVILCIGPIVGISANVLAHLILCRSVSYKGHVRIQLISIALGAAVTFASLVVLQEYAAIPWLIWADDALVHMFTYTFLSFCFFNLISSTSGSLRVRMLREYLSCYPKSLSSGKLQTLYSVNAMLEARLNRLLAGGQIGLRGVRYIAKRGVVHYIGLLFYALEKLLMKNRHNGAEEVKQ